MSLRWRNKSAGQLLCAATHPAVDNDIYIDDEQQYQLAVIARVIYPDEDEETNGIWHIKNYRVFTYILFGDNDEPEKD